jgi:glutamyl-tRNA synthetase
MPTTQDSKKVRVRIAPSPTGFFHIGTARTALFNWLFARHTGGSFIVRIEDTDRERSTKEFEKNILEGIAWLGLDYDEGPLPDGTDKGAFGPYRQTQRLASYEKQLVQLLSEGKAYYCFCTKEKLDAERKAQEAAGGAPKYAGTCAGIDQEAARARQAAGEPCVIRLKVAPVKVSFTDDIRGEVVFDNSFSGDIVIAKNLREPLYNFAVVIDDYEMQITHVIRGEDHVANTPKQIAIQDALGIPHVEYAHLPLILNSDRSKMSKRFNATSVDEYRKKGYLPEAMINFLALLGWHPVDDNEVLSATEIQQAFEISRIQKGGAIFNVEKLNFFNQQYLKKLSAEQIAERLIASGEAQASALLVPAINLVRERAVLLSDFPALYEFIFNLPAYEPAILVWKKGTAVGAVENLTQVASLCTAVPEGEWRKETLEGAIMPLAEARGKGDVLWPLRVALSGKEQSPAPIDIMIALGKGESLRRIEAARIKAATLSS